MFCDVIATWSASLCCTIRIIIQAQRFENVIKLDLHLNIWKISVLAISKQVIPKHHILWRHYDVINKCAKFHHCTPNNKKLRPVSMHFGEFGRATKWLGYQGTCSSKSKLKASVYWRTRDQFWKLNQVQLFRDQNERKPVRLLLLNARTCDRTGSRDQIRWSGNRCHRDFSPPWSRLPGHIPRDLGPRGQMPGMSLPLPTTQFREYCCI